MSGRAALPLDVLIFGGGVAGLWLLDELVRRGYEALLVESASLGAGQTSASQGILHGGMKYTLDGLFSASAAAIAEMPLRWRACLAGQRGPDLRGVRLRAEYCHLWRTRSLRSRVGLLGARAGLRIAPQRLAPDAWPVALRGCPGEVYRLDEQVLDPRSVLETLRAAQAARVRAYDPGSLCVAGASAPEVELAPPGGAALRLKPRHIVLCAGAGNEELARRCGAAGVAQQRRPLHMVLVCGPLPELNGHCTDGAHTRVTISSAPDAAGRMVWQVGGQLAEDGVALEEGALLARAAAELSACLPAFEPRGLLWASYRVDRAEPATPGGRRPNDVTVVQRGAMLIAWPTKLALAPRLAERVIELLPPPAASADARELTAAVSAWPQPPVAAPPWERVQEWRGDAG